MSDSVSGLLRWILAHDTPTKVILTCSHSPAHDPGRFELAVILQGCVSHAPLGLPAQILACGVSRVEYMPCPHDPVGAQRMHAIWQGLTPGLVGEAASAKKHFRHGTVIDLAAVPLPRRVLFGAGSDGPLDLASDDQSRTLAALRSPERARSNLRGGQRPRRGRRHSPARFRMHRVQRVRAGMPSRRAGADGGHGGFRSHVPQSGPDHRAVPLVSGCVRFCPVQAVTPGRPHDLLDVLDGRRELIAHVATRACPRCGSIHPADQGELCSVCRYREGNPFGSQLPPELAHQLPPDIAERLMRPVSRTQQKPAGAKPEENVLPDLATPADPFKPVWRGLIAARLGTQFSRGPGTSASPPYTDSMNLTKAA